MKRKITASYFDKDYWMTPFCKSGYSIVEGYYQGNYLQPALAELLTKLYGKRGKWLEIGCAFGWVMKELMLLGVDVYGFDISKYAIKNCDEIVDGRVKCSDGLDRKLYKQAEFDFAYSFETAEHIHWEDIERWISNINYWLKPQAPIFFTICLGIGNVRGLSDIDESHQTLQPRYWWHDLLVRCGFEEDKEKYDMALNTSVYSKGMVAPENVVKRYNYNVFAYKKVRECDL